MTKTGATIGYEDHGFGARPSYLSLVTKRDWLRSASQAWMVTFTDLVALMLAFFVLLFAMSQVEQREVETIKPVLEYQPAEEAVVPGADLDYLAPVLRQQIAAQASLARATIHRLPDRLVVSLPAELLYQANLAVLAPGAREVGFALGGVLRNLDNRIEVEALLRGSERARGPRADWQLALARAALFTGMLTRAGYRGAILARGIARSGAGRDRAPRRDGPRRLTGDRLDIVIHELAQEPE
jgi:chemotaxis protein MotB